MSLILAIEPDRRQVAQLISIVRHVAGAELVLADTTERALESIGNGVPDLILVPALLSPQDDAALAAALRVIATAAHVQMLTIPTFATAKARPKSRGMLSAFRRKPVEDAPLEGCDPKVFAEQISSYLQRASEERAAAQLLEDDADEMAADSFAAPAQAFEDLPAGFESADASTFDETSAEEAPVETWMAASAPAEQYAAPVEQYAAPVELAETVTAVEAATVAEPSLSVVEEIFDEPLPETSIAAAPEQPAPLVELVETLEQTVPLIEDVYEEPLPEMSLASATAEPAMALEEFAATLARTEPPAVVEAHPSQAMATAAIDENAFVDLDVDLTTELEEAVPELAMGSVPDAQLPGLDELLADFERADLPVIEEVRAEQWMDAPVEIAVESEEETDEPNQTDIDASNELEAVLKPFAPVVPVERFEPFPLAAWQSWPRLEGTVSASSRDEGSDRSDSADSQVAEFEAALFEAVHQEEEALERFEPVVPVESLEPMPLAAWQCWPRLEGVMAEAYQEPITPRKAVARPEWVELMRSLREDIARRRAELSSPAPQPTQTPQAPRKPQAPLPQAAKPAPPAAAADALKKRPKRTRPIEDEWGLFDPEQCGFAALLDKLDEITVPPPSSNTRRQA